MIVDITPKKNQMTKAEYELAKVLEKHEEELKDKVKDFITHSYFNSMMEIERRKLAEKAGVNRPRIDYFLHSMFFYVFFKLHKGSKVKAYELIKELEEELSTI